MSPAIPTSVVETVGLCGGAGDFLLDRARALGIDVYLTSDLRHHPASELREHGAPALVDVAHWAAESTWSGAPVVGCSTPWEIRWRSRQHDEHRPVDLPGLRSTTTSGESSESRPVRPAQAARRPGARLPDRPPEPPATSIPEADQLRELAGRRTALANAVRDLRIQVDDLGREQRRADADVEQVKTRRARDQGMIDAGQVKDPKALDGCSVSWSPCTAGSPPSRTPSSR